MARPEPKNLNVVCSECGQSWEDHGENPSSEDCVRLLLAALAKSTEKNSELARKLAVARANPFGIRPYIRTSVGAS